MTVLAGIVGCYAVGFGTSKAYFRNSIQQDDFTFVNEEEIAKSDFMHRSKLLAEEAYNNQRAETIQATKEALDIDNVSMAAATNTETDNFVDGTSESVTTTDSTATVESVAERVTREIDAMREELHGYNNVPLGERYTSCSVNLRAECDTDSESLAVLPANTPVSVQSVNGEWRKVIVNGTEGFVKTEFLLDEMIEHASANRWGISLTDTEIDLLARIAYQESHNQELVGIEAVVEVVFNRMKRNHQDLYTVLSAPGQFATWHMRYDDEPTSKELDAINNVLCGNTYILSEDYVFFATYPANGKDFIKIGAHYFGRE